MNDEALNKKLEHFQSTKQMIPIQATEGCPAEYQSELRRLSEVFLDATNKRQKADEELKKLKASEESAEKQMIRFLDSINSTGIEFADLGNFSKKESIHANILQSNEPQVFDYYKSQRREKEFFEVKLRKGNLDHEIRSLIIEAEHKEGGLEKSGNLQLPPGITIFKKMKIGVTKRNHQFELSR